MTLGAEILRFAQDDMTFKSVRMRRDEGIPPYQSKVLVLSGN